MTRVLENNLKPATHFIEVWSVNGKHDQHNLPNKTHIPTFDRCQFPEWVKPIAIFKIRMKPQ